ncbi:hypothetical protein KEM54_005446 [Ascosphaera aggregata]|nr:hypothetical protein KEM54_005446 [Ascosphaera aggregata]
MSLPSSADTADKSPILTPQSESGSQTSCNSNTFHPDASGIRQTGIDTRLIPRGNASSMFSPQSMDPTSSSALETWDPLGFTAIPLGNHTRKNSRFASAFAHRDVPSLKRAVGAPTTGAIRSASISTAIDERERQSPVGPQTEWSISGSLAGTGWNLNQAMKDSLGPDQQHSPVIAPLATIGLRAGMPANMQPSSTATVADDLISPLALRPQTGTQSFGSQSQSIPAMWNLESISGFADPFALGQQQPHQQQQRTHPARPTSQRTMTSGSNKSVTAASNASVPFSGGSTPAADDTISPRASLRQRQPPAANRALSSINWPLDSNLNDPLRQASPLNSPPSPTAFQRSSFSITAGGRGGLPQDDVQATGASNPLHRTTSRESAASSTNSFAFPVPWSTVPPNQYRSQSFSVATLGGDRTPMLGSLNGSNRGLSKVWEDEVVSDGYGSDGPDGPIQEAASYNSIDGNLHGQGFSPTVPFSGTNAGSIDIPEARLMIQKRRHPQQQTATVRRMSEMSPTQISMLQRGFANNENMHGIDNLMLETEGYPDNDGDWNNGPTLQRRCSEKIPSGRLNISGSQHAPDIPNPGVLRTAWNDNSAIVTYTDRGKNYYSTPPISPISTIKPSGQLSGPRRSSFNQLPNMLEPLTVDPQLARRHSAANVSVNRASISPHGFASSLPCYGPEGMTFPLSPTRDGFQLPMENPCECNAFKPHVHSQHPNGLPPLSRSTAPPCRPDSPLYIVTFKCFRAGIYYIPDGSSIHVEVGDLVFVDADRGQDLGSVAAVNLDQEQARAAKEWYDRQHLQWLMMYSRFWQGGNAVQPFLQPDRPLGVAFAMAPSSTHLQGSGRRRDINPRPKYIKRVLPSEAPEGLRNKEALENKAKRLCQERVASRGMQMEILDAEYQWDSHKLTLYFYAGSYINFNDLVEDMFREYKTRIWMEAVNPGPFQNPANYPLNNAQPYIYRPLHPMTNSPECEKYTNNINILANDVANFQRQSLMHATIMTQYPIAPTTAEMDVPYLDPYHVFLSSATKQLHAQPSQQQQQTASFPIQAMSFDSSAGEQDKFISIFDSLSIS